MLVTDWKVSNNPYRCGSDELRDSSGSWTPMNILVPPACSGGAWAWFLHNGSCVGRVLGHSYIWKLAKPQVLSFALLWIHPTFRNRGTAYNSRSFAGNLLFVGDYGSWCSSTTIFTVSSIMLMWNLVNFWFPWQLLRFLRFSIVIPS